MNLKKIIIFDSKELFAILNEIKDFLNLEIDYADKKNLNQKIKDLNSNFLIISNVKISNLENNINIVIDKTPIKITKIIQSINLHLLKNNFIIQSEKEIGPYKLNLNSREISKDKIKLNLTEREANLILYLKNSSLPVNINKLEKDVWKYESELETHTVETHIYRLRKKIKDKFNDDNFILSSKNGYKIN